MSIEFIWVAIAVISIVSTARITRLITFDKLPPVAWLREKWVTLWGESEWATLVVCPYCFSMYAAALVLLWGYFTHWDLYWWLFNGWMAMSYLGAIVMVKDGDD